MAAITIRSINYIPSFRGRHNRTKVKAWLILYDHALDQTPFYGIKLLDWARESGVNYKSLATLIPKWIKYRYVGYITKYQGRKAIRYYHLNKRGKRWLDRWRDYMPLDAYINEIENRDNTGG